MFCCVRHCTSTVVEDGVCRHPMKVYEARSSRSSRLARLRCEGMKDVVASSAVSAGVADCNAGVHPPCSSATYPICPTLQCVHYYSALNTGM